MDQLVVANPWETLRRFTQGSMNEEPSWRHR